MLVTTPYHTLIQHDIYIAINTFRVRKRHAIHTGFLKKNKKKNHLMTVNIDHKA